MKLFFSPSACSLSPHIVAREAGLPIELDKVNQGTKQTASGLDYRTINPRGYVPALQLDDGSVLTEGPVIVQYLADQKPESKLVPPAGTIERYRMQELLNYISTEIHKTFSPLFNPKTPDDYKPIAKERLAAQFDYLSKVLGDKNYLTGDTFTAADAYLFVTLRWTAFVGIDLAKWPVLQAFVGRVTERPAVQAALAAEKLADHEPPWPGRPETG